MSCAMQINEGISVIGAGLAGSEAAWQIAQKGIRVKLFEMRGGGGQTPAHQTQNFAELVCSNSFRSDDIENAVGLLHEEMRRCGSLILRAADKHKIPAGSALAVDREGFAEEVMRSILQHPNISVQKAEVMHIDVNSPVIIATGPLTSNPLALEIKKLTGEEHLAFFDAIAPIVYKESIDFEQAWFQSRYDKGSGRDYINCPLTKEEYYDFIDALLLQEKTEFKDWEQDAAYFNGCLPIEVMASRGRETLRFGPMKPVGLRDPRTEKKPYAVVQLRQDNALGTLYNIVGFQTKIKHSSQKEVFSKIPGLQNAEFARLGGLHRNTFINSPNVLNANLSLKQHQQVKFAGQITGVEGYLESAAIGLLAGFFAANEYLQRDMLMPPEETALGALLKHITHNANASTFQPMNINYGLFKELDGNVLRQDRKRAYSARALEKLNFWIYNASLGM